MKLYRAAAVAIGASFAFSCHAADLVLNPVSLGGGAYAIIGDLGPPTYDNGGLNANLGFVVTDDGVVVIDSGPSVQAARALHAAIRKVTRQPLRLVINTNAQTNRWHGNAYFRDLGVPLVAHAEAVKQMNESAGMQIEASRGLLKDKAAGSVAAIPEQRMDSERRVSMGGMEIQILHFGAAHTRGDIAVWLPAAGILFAGDIVYTERLPAVIPAGRSAAWPATIDAMLRLEPKIIVPGHGAPTGAARALSDTRGYLVFLRSAVKEKLDAGASVQEAVDGIDQGRYSHLENFRELSRRNAFQVYLELEFE